MWILIIIVLVILLGLFYKPVNDWLMNMFAKTREQYNFNYTQFPPHVMKRHMDNYRESPVVKLGAAQRRGIFPPGYMPPYKERMKKKRNHNLDFVDLLKNDNSKIPVGYIPKVNEKPNGVQEKYMNPLGKMYLSLRSDVGNVISDTVELNKPLDIVKGYY
jgi:hypothetical protein